MIVVVTCIMHQNRDRDGMNQTSRGWERDRGHVSKYLGNSFWIGESESMWHDDGLYVCVYVCVCVCVWGWVGGCMREREWCVYDKKRDWECVIVENDFISSPWLCLSMASDLSCQFKNSKKNRWQWLDVDKSQEAQCAFFVRFTHQYCKMPFF